MSQYTAELYNFKGYINVTMYICDTSLVRICTSRRASFHPLSLGTESNMALNVHVHVVTPKLCLPSSDCISSSPLALVTLCTPVLQLLLHVVKFCSALLLY